MQKWLMVLCLAYAYLFAPLPASGQSVGGKGESIDARLRRAGRFVARSDKYMHQSRLRRGMTGYGLTVLAGTKIEKFNVIVVSVMRNWYPHQDVILCRLSGLGLEKSGIIQGMSGSPIYIKDPADGKHKMIGALAYGWSFQKEPVCGIQPITQMLAIQGVPLPGAPVAKPKPAAAAGKGELDADLVRAVLLPEKIDFSAMAIAKRSRAARTPGDRAAHDSPFTTRKQAAPTGYSASNLRRPSPRLIPLATPIMVTGAGSRTIGLAEKVFVGTGLVPMRAGSVGAAEADAAKNTRLAPGSSVSVPLISGDLDWTGVGTVTEIIGDRVLAFGHSMFAEGPVQMPMGTAYVHTVISSMSASFKLGSTLKITGALTHDESTGVSGQVGRKAEMIPMTVTCHWPTGEQKFSYRLLRHRWFTAVLARLVVANSVYANRTVPERHTIEYAVDIEFEKFGRYKSTNISSGSDIAEAVSDLTRPLVAMMNTPLGKPVFPKSINVTVAIRPVRRVAGILSVAIDRNVYKPGEKVTAQVTLRPYRAERAVKTVSITLPKDLPDGRYSLTVCTAEAVARARMAEMPHKFRPRTVEQLFDAIKNVVEPRADRLYVCLPLPEGGLAVKKNELEHLPVSIAGLLSRAAPTDTNAYRRSKIESFRTNYVLAGSVGAGFTVIKHPRREH